MADLPDAAAEAAVRAVASHPWDTTQRSAHRDHVVDVECAVCRGDVPALVAVAVKAAAPLIAAQARTEERAAIARMVRSFFAAADAPLYEDVRILCERIERGEHLPARTTGADQPAAEPITPPKTAPEMRCSECGRPLVDQPCGLVHGFVRMQIAAIRMGLSSLLRGGEHA